MSLSFLSTFFTLIIILFIPLFSTILLKIFYFLMCGFGILFPPIEQKVYPIFNFLLVYHLVELHHINTNIIIFETFTVLNGRFQLSEKVPILRHQSILVCEHVNKTEYKSMYFMLDTSLLGAAFINTFTTMG